MTAYLFVNTGKPKALHVMHQVGALLHAEGAQLLVDGQCDAAAAKAIQAVVKPVDEAVLACDIVISIGGDGTMLHAARHTMQHGKPLLGVNIGRLGFLSSVESDELGNLRRLLKGDYNIENRSVLQAVVGDDSAPLWAFNDIVLYKESVERTISLDIYCDDIMVSKFRGDGIIFATPTGSTAYSMSAGGPIVDAHLNSIVVTQICAHIVQTPPMVFSPNRVLKAVPYGGKGEQMLISCDGQDAIVVHDNKPVTIRQSSLTVPLIQFGDAEQLESIDKKLKGR